MFKQIIFYTTLLLNVSAYGMDKYRTMDEYRNDEKRQLEEALNGLSNHVHQKKERSRAGNQQLENIRMSNSQQPRQENQDILTSWTPSRLFIMHKKNVRRSKL